MNAVLQPPSKGGSSSRVRPKVRPPVRQEPIQPQIEEETEVQIPDEPPRKGAGSADRPISAVRPVTRPRPRPAIKGPERDKDAAGASEDEERLGHAAPEPYQFSFTAEGK